MSDMSTATKRMLTRRAALLWGAATVAFGVGCRDSGPAPASPESDAPRLKVQGVRWVEDLPIELVQFETVFWDARDTESLRRWLREHAREIQGADVLEIGSGSGLLSMCCLKHGARSVIATDINPAAVANTRYNAERLGFADRLQTRLVSQDAPEAFSALGPDERFDWIVSNPPWEDAVASGPADFAFYDEEFRLLDSLLAGMAERLKPNGTALLAYGAKTAIQRILARAPDAGLEVELRDDRELASLDENFLPGMLLLLRRRTVDQ